MNETTTHSLELQLALPENAPLVRVTAGVGSAGQKTWNLRRPVTLIGSRRPAHIVIHDTGISKAHCVIVNTGSEVLLKDLHTHLGTYTNQTKIDLTLLKDGDVAQISETTIQIAIQNGRAGEGEDSGAGGTLPVATKLRNPLSLRLKDSDRCWLIEDAVAVIGRQPEASIFLDHELIAARHAILFRFGESPAVYDLGSRTGLSVNGERCTFCCVEEGDILTIGPFHLVVGAADRAAGQIQGRAAGVAGQAGDLAGDGCKDPDADVEGTLKPSAFKSPSEGGTPVLSSLQRSIAESWTRLNGWRDRFQPLPQAVTQNSEEVNRRGAELDAKDAAIRGQLHDLTRYHEQLESKALELAAEIAGFEGEKDRMIELGTTIAERESDLETRNAELSRREHVVAQRWTRLSSLTCPHCRKPIQQADT